MKTFGFRKPPQKTNIIHKIILNLNYTYIFLLLLSFSFFSTFSNISKVISHDNLNITNIKELFADLAVYSYPFDSSLTSFFMSSKYLISSYNDWNKLLHNNLEDINFVLNYIQDNHDKINYITNNKYNKFFDFFSDSLEHREDLYKILWKEEKQTYIVALQNSNESRPNGWFFGSFLRLDFYWWKLLEYEIIDSYYVNHIDPDANVESPQRREKYIWSEKIWFVSSNVLGFTDKDAKNIIDIYEQAFPEEEISWVIFLQSSFLESIYPSIRNKIWEWQFINANTDEIRWDDWPWKKDIYKEELGLFLENNLLSIIKNFFENFQIAFEDSNVQVYMPNTSSEFRDFLIDNNLKTVYDDEYLFLWDFNYSYNKIDWFVEKDLSIFSWDNLLKNTSWDILEHNLYSWDYRINIWYNISVSNYYKNYINNLSEFYDIELSEREEHILNLTYVFDNMWMIYMPSNFEVNWLSWYYDKYNFIELPNYNLLLYWISWKENNKYYNLSIDLTVN